MTLRGPSALDRAIALVLTWVVPGSSAWALTPLTAPSLRPTTASVASELSPAITDDRNDDRKDDKKDGRDKDRDKDKGHNDDRDRDNDDHNDRDRDRDGHHDDDHDDDDALRPILECVVRHSHNSYTAYFGYKNETNKTITVPVGSKNSFSPSPQNRNQPTVFPKGRSPHYPNAAFSVPFNGSSLTWSLRGPNSDTKAVTARSSSNRCEATPNPTPTPTPTATPTPIPTPTPPATCANPVLTERRYTRTSGVCNGHGHGRHDRDDDDNGPTVYSQTFTLPAGSVGPYTLRVVNGDALGRNRTSSAEVKINGALVVGPSDFSQNVTTFTKTIATLQANNQIYVKVSGAPGSTFTIGICGADPGDTVPPSVNWISPLEGELSSDPSPLLRVRYTDLVSNPNPATLKVLIDGVDQTALFNRQPDEASLDGLVTLPDGTHTLRAEIQDQAGNLGAATRTFRTDATSPTLLIAAPPSGAMSSEARPQIRLTFADAGTEPSGVIPTSLAVSLDGVDITAALTRTATDAAGLPPTALASGPHQLSATIADVAGNTTTVTSGFHVDTVPPVVTTVSPTANQVLGAATVAVAVLYSDNHELNLDSFRATIDGVAVPVVVDADSASGSMSGLVDGPHLLTLSIADRAGNVRTTTTAFSTDTGGPQIAVVTPPNGVLLNLRNPELLVTFEDGQGLDLSSLRIRVNGADRTADFTRTATDARATLADALPEGVNTIAVEIRDQASNLGAASSSFTLDVTAPSVTVRAPIANAFLNDPTPDVQIELADSLTGVEPTATRIFVDDIDVTADFSIGPTLAAGTLSNALSEGQHTLRVVTADRAANPTVAEVVFVIDLTAPTLEMASPREGSFTNDSTPEIWLRTADPISATGIGPAAGVSSASIRVFLLSTDPAVPDTDLTSLLTIDASESRGEVTTALPDGTHRLRAVARDHAGNEAEITVGFVVDTTAPTVTIDQPQNGTFLPTAEPTIVLLYSDERSGIDPDLTQVKVDGIERAASLTLTATGARLTLSSVLGLSLADGPHQIEARVVDQAGNAMEATPVTFGVDTVAPTAAITSPVHQSFVGVAQPSVAFTLQDAAPSSGINTEFIRVFLDGVDITANATLTPGGDGALTATATVAMPLSDGLHTLRVTAIDNANQQAEAISQFTVDTTPPVVTPAGPGNGSTIGASLTNGNGTFTLTFSFVDIDPSTTATCTSGPTSVSASPQGEGHSCILPIVEGLNTFAVMVTDSTGHSSTLAKTLILDTLVPGVAISTPLAASVTSAQTLTVHGTVADATAVTVSVNGVPATVVPGFNGSPTTFEAQGVVVGPGPSATFEAVAQDLGGNTGRASVSVVVDRTLPLVTISTPANGAYLPGVPATVNAEVVDASATTLEINGVMATRGACQPAATAQEPSRQRCSYEASVPVSPGAFQIVAAARDAASNQGVAQVSVIVDATAPVLTVTAPAAGLVTSATSITVIGTVADTSPATLTTDGAPTALGAEGAFSADIPAGPEGLRTIQLLARDAAGNETARSISVIVDRTAPALTIGQPTNAARLGSSSTPVIVQFADDQLDPSTFVATLDGAPFTMTLAEGSATGLAENLAEGPHTVSVRIADRAGNVTTREITFTVDTIVPSITIERPAPSFLMPTATPFVSVAFSDAQGVDTATLRIRVDGIDVTSRFTITPGSATATLLPLAEGAHTIVAEIMDLTLNLASATASFSTDTVAPVVPIVSPLAGARLNTSTPQISFTYQDPGGDASSGVDPPTIRVLLDGLDITAAFVLSGGDATGTAPAPLTDGSHTLRVEAKDRAANSTFAETTFLVDTQAPVATFGAPLDGSFTNDTTPDVLITFADPGATASGISPSVVRVFLTAVGAGSPEVDVTSALVVGPTTITGALPGPLAAGTYRVRVTLRDEALNSSEVATTFEVDLTPPTFEIVQPAAGSAILTGSPAFVIRYADDRSGLATDRFAFRVDGVDRTARLTVGASEASGTLLAEEALADGPHSYDFTLFDRAGNRTDSGSISFVVDSAPPTAVFAEPAPQSFIGANTPRVRFQFQDPAPSSGINTAATRIQVDGVDRTPDFTITADGAVVAALSPAIGDGLHTVRADIADRSGSAGFVVAQFTVDTAAPVLTSEIPEEGRLVGGGALVDGRATISGTATDLDPALTVTCSSPAGPGVATLSNASYSCSVPVAEGANEISVTATDTTAHSATITRTLTVDRIAPAIQITDPTEGAFTSVQSLTVTGTVSDASSAAGVTVSVNGQAAAVTPGTAGGPATFEASNVSVGAGPTAAFEVVATDAAGNAATATVTVRVDRDPPLVAITQPASGDYLRGGVTTVTVDVTDDTTTILDINGIPGAHTGCVDVAQGQPGALTAEAKRCTFTADIPLIAGNTTIVATAFDAAGNRGVNQVSTIVDNTPPAISVTSPGPGLITNATSVSVVGTITDDSPVALTVNGQAVTVAPGGSFSATIANDVLGMPLSGIEGVREIVFVARDAAGNETTTSVSVLFDRTPPALTVASPLQGAIIPSSSVALSGTVADATAVTITVEGSPATVTGQAWSTTLASLVEGSLTITVRAVDAAGNESTVIREVEVDLGPPTVAITSPAAGTLTREATALLAFSVLDRSSTSITLNGAPVAPACPGVIACDRTQSVDLGDGDNTFTVEATDAGGRTASAVVTVTRDSNAPSIELLAPERASRGRVATASVSAVDNLALASVEVRVGSTVLCTGVAACSGPIGIPEEARPGDSLTLTATATDTAGNTTTTSRTVRVISDGVVTGTVLNDLTSLPLAGATVTLLGPNTRSTTTNEEGRYNIPVVEISAILRIEKAGMTSVDRVVSVISGTGTVPVDGRLTPIAAVIRATSVTPSLGEGLGRGPLTLSVPDGDHQVTLLSAQGLPNLLPPGFSPLTAFNWMPENASASARVTVALPTGTVTLPETVLVRYDPAMRDWRVVAKALVAVAGVIEVDLFGPGSYALVVPDAASTVPEGVGGIPVEGTIAIGNVGEPLAGIAIATIPATATSEGRVDPPVLPPTGGTATGLLRIDSPTPLPSGTIVQADLEETYTLSSGEEASAPKRSVDVIAFKHSTLATAWGTGDNAGAITGATNSTTCAPSTPPAPGSEPLEHLCAAFPITPSRTYSNASLREGRVKLDLLAGRENARGVVGGSEAVTVVAGSVQLNVAAGSLAEDTAIALWSYEDYSPFIPTTNGITPLGEVTVDFASSTLNTSAALTFRNVTAAPGDTLVVARVDRAAYDGIPRLQVVALADVISANDETNAVTRVDTGLPGLTLEGVKKEGRYTLLRLAGPIGWITGTATASGSPLRALVTTDSLPFVATSNTSGVYAIPAVPGPVTLTARVLGQSLIGGAQTTAVEGAPATANLLLEGAVSQATITPASGAIGVEVNDLLTLTSPVALNPATVVPANISLRRVPPQACAEPDPPASLNCAATPIPLRLVLSGSGKHLSIIPTTGAVPEPVGGQPTGAVPESDGGLPVEGSALAFSTHYALEITGLLDTVGGLVTAPTTTFRTKDDIKPVYNLKALTFSFPNAEGLVTVSAPAGTLPPGTEILIINSGNGVVLGLTAGNDGEVNGTLPASTQDTLLISVTDPFGNSVIYRQSQFVDNASGETAIGPGGGSIDGPGGTGLDIPEGALNDGGGEWRVKLTLVPESDYPALYPRDVLSKLLGDDLHAGHTLKLEANRAASFSREVDVRFPLPDFTRVPPDQRPPTPKDAFYTVHRRVLACPNGGATCDDAEKVVIFEVIDEAKVQCKAVPSSNGPNEVPATCAAEDMEIVTASPPFAGLIGTVLTTMLFLSWALPALAVDFGRPTRGLIRGRVTRQTYVEGKLTLEPVRYALVSGVSPDEVDDEGNPRPVVHIEGGAGTRSAADGTYAFWDRRYAGGPIEVTAFADGATVRARGFEVVPGEPSFPRYKQEAVVNITLPAQTPPLATPDIQVTLVRADNSAINLRGLAPVGLPLQIGIKSSIEGQSITLYGVDINGVNYPTMSDSTGHFDYLLNVPFMPSTPGTYRLTATALRPIGDPIAFGQTFRIVAAGGEIETDLSNPPSVVEGSTAPKKNAKGISVGSFVSLTFSEPVTKVLQNLEFTSNGGPVPFRASAVAIDQSVIEDLSTAPTAAITSVTLQPLYGLKFGETYTVIAHDGIEDLDKDDNNQPSPKRLMPVYQTSFETFGPETINPDSPDAYSTGGFVILKTEQAITGWALKHMFSPATWNGLLMGYDASDPANLTQISSTFVQNRVIDIAGEGTTLVVATGANNKSRPGNLLVFDVTNPAKPAWVGAATISSGASDGTPARIRVRGDKVYAATWRKGIQIASIDGLKAGFVPCCSAAHNQMSSSLNNDGGSFNSAAVPTTIDLIDPVTPSTRPWMRDLSVIDVQGETIIAVATSFGLALANEAQVNVFYRGLPGVGGLTMAYAYAVETALVDSRSIVLVAGIDETGNNILVLMDISEPGNPVPIGSLLLATQGKPIADIAIHDGTAYIGFDSPVEPLVEVVQIGDPTQPTSAGVLKKGVGGRLQVVDGILYGASYGYATEGVLGGIRTAALRRILLLQNKTTSIPLSEAGVTGIAAEISYKIVPAEPGATGIKVEVLRESTAIQDITGPFDGSKGFTTWPAGMSVQAARYFVEAIADEGAEEELRSIRVPLPVSRVTVELSNEHGVLAAKTASGQTVIENTWDRSGTNLEPPLNGWQYENSSRTFSKALMVSSGRPPTLPNDYVELTLGGAGVLVWTEIGGNKIKLDVPDDIGRVTATLKATRDLTALSIERIPITAEYFAEPGSEPLKLETDFVNVLNERLHGRLYDIAAAAVGQGEGDVQSVVTELGVGMIPVAGDAAGIVGEAINAFNPSADVSKLNLSLSLIGLATEFGQITGPAGVVLDKGVTFIRVGMRQITSVGATALVLKGMPTRLLGHVKLGQWDELADLAQGTFKLSMIGGGKLAKNVLRTDDDIAAVNRFMKTYSGDLLDSRFTERLRTLDDVLADPDAVRGAIRALADFKDSTQAIIRLSDEAVEGAVQFMGLAKNVPTDLRAGALRRILEGTKDEAETVLRFMAESNDPDVIKGFGRYFSEAPCVIGQ